MQQHLAASLPSCICLCQHSVLQLVLTRTLSLQLERAVRDGIDVRGVMYWTLIECATV